MTMSAHLLKRAIGLWKSGQKVQARKIFEAIIYNDRQNEAAWIWYIYSLPTNPEKIAALETFLSILPDHPVGQKALRELRVEESHQTQRPVKIPDPMQETVLPRTAAAPLPQTPRPIQKPASRALPWILVLSGLCILLFGTFTLFARYESLQYKYQSLDRTNRLISQNYDQLNRDYESLKSENIGLTLQYDTLNGAYSTLLGDYNTLSAEHTTLQNNYNSLMADYNSTVQSYSDFREIAIAPPYIYTRERKVHLVFRKLDGSLLQWTIDSEWLEYHLRRGDELRSNLTYDLRLYNEFTDETYNVVDDRDFVDVTPFTNLMADLYHSSPDDYSFIREVWNIVAQLTAYTSEIRETPRFPMETLLSGGGDCEDHAILFASMILASPAPWEVKFIYMDADHPTRPEGMNHVIVQVITDDRPYLVEATSKLSMDPYSDGVYGWFFSINRAK